MTDDKGQVMKYSRVNSASLWKGSLIITLLWAGCSATAPVDYEEQYVPEMVPPSVQGTVGKDKDTKVSKSKRDESAPSRRSSSKQSSDDKEVGTASWYGPGFQGKKTASGERFNQNELTAAHPTLPIGSKAEVKNLETGKAVEVEINDRGPFVKGRDIDLSRAAAKEVGLTKKKGTAKVAIEPTAR